MAPHSSALAWRIPWMEKPDRLRSMGSLGVGHDWMTSLSLFTFMHWRRKWQPTPVFLPGESQGRGAWWAAVYGVAQSQARLKRLSSSSSSSSEVVNGQVAISGYIHLRGRRQGNVAKGWGLKRSGKRVSRYLLISTYFVSTQYTQNTSDVTWLGFSC